MKRLMLAVIFAVMLFGTIAVCYAEREYGHGEIRSRIHDARERIDRGIEKGSLTRHEARKLIEELDSILGRLDRMKEDGRLSPREREKIIRDLDRLDRHITREKRDDDRRRY